MKFANFCCILSFNFSLYPDLHLFRTTFFESPHIINGDDGVDDSEDNDNDSIIPVGMMVIEEKAFGSIDGGMEIKIGLQIHSV